LSAVRGFDWLEHLDDPAHAHLHGNLPPPDEITDEDIGYLSAVGDTAGAAAMAWACRSRTELVYDPDRLLGFWTWWTDEALPAAWAGV
jgi:hypothetical protein